MVLLFYLVVCPRVLEGSTKCKRDWSGLTFKTGSWCIVECCKLSAKFPIWSGDIRSCSSSSSSMEFQWISSPPISFVPWVTVFFSHFSNISAILPLFNPINSNLPQIAGHVAALWSCGESRYRWSRLLPEVVFSPDFCLISAQYLTPSCSSSTLTAEWISSPPISTVG